MAVKMCVLCCRRGIYPFLCESTPDLVPSAWRRHINSVNKPSDLAEVNRQGAMARRGSKRCESNLGSRQSRHIASAEPDESDAVWHRMNCSCHVIQGRPGRSCPAVAMIQAAVKNREKPAVLSAGRFHHQTSHLARGHVQQRAV